MIKEISEEQFEAYNFMRFPTFSAKEMSWFADDDANIIGTVLLDNYDKDWSYVILGLNTNHQYELIGIAVSIDTEEKAFRDIFSKMQQIATAGKAEQDLYKSNLFDNKSTLIITDINEEVKVYFAKHPEKLYEITPRKFEELIASIMEDFGFTVELTKATRDGGRDMIISLRNAVSNFLAYVECKRYAADNKIDVGIVRQVQGVHYTLKPAKSIIVTTSFFTKDAVEEAKRIENQLDLKDFNNIKEWLEHY